MKFSPRSLQAAFLGQIRADSSLKHPEDRHVKDIDAKLNTFASFSFGGGFFFVRKTFPLKTMTTNEGWDVVQNIPFATLPSWTCVVRNEFFVFSNAHSSNIPIRMYVGSISFIERECVLNSYATYTRSQTYGKTQGRSACDHSEKKYHRSSFFFEVRKGEGGMRSKYAN